MPRVFKVQSCIGRGGFGEVYLATVYAPDEPERSVALKILHADLDPKSLAVQRLRDESAMLRALDHPNILKADDLAVLDGRVALVTEYIEGADLDTLIKQRPLPIGPALQIIGRVAAALHDAQTHEVDGAPLALVHRDVKPANIRIGQDGEVRLLDFGVARTERIDREAHTATDVVMGSLPFIAPEVLTEAHATHACDTYALGVTLYYSLRGERIFRQNGPDLFGLLISEQRFSFELAKRLPLLGDPALVELVGSMVARDPTTRPSHAEVRERVEALAQGASPTLADFCSTYAWPGHKSLPGLLSGRVLEEQAVDPRSITTPSGGVRRPIDPEGQALTQMGLQAEEEPTEPADSPVVAELARELADRSKAPPAEPTTPAASRSGPPTTGRRGAAGPSALQVGLAVAGIGLLMVVGFVGAFAAGTFLLP